MLEPEGILGEIVRRKRRDVEERLSAISLTDLRARAAPTTRSLRQALKRPGARFILEIKRASPSAGRLAANAKVAEFASHYRGAADAISVLTDQPFFGGSLGDLKRARSFFEGPILAKDFIVDPRQVAEARIDGADAVLVMLSVLSVEEASIVIREAELLGMDALVEVHDEAELSQAIALGAKLIGINNRDLKTMELDLGVTQRLAPKVPRDAVVVAESGITNRSSVELLSPLVDAFLIGSALMTSDRPAQCAREIAYGRVKICGVTSLADARLAADAGASHLGFIFVPSSPRTITIEQAGPIVVAARERGLKTVGVFRNEPPIEVSMIAWRLELNVVQLHGDEDESYVRMLRTFLAGRAEIWAAQAVGDEPARNREGADRTLFDTLFGVSTGGTGRTFDWSLAQHLMSDAILAGGLNPTNIRAAAATGAWALDVASGVEAEPGRKDPAKLNALFDALRPKARSEAQPCS